MVFGCPKNASVPDYLLLFKVLWAAILWKGGKGAGQVGLVVRCKLHLYGCFWKLIGKGAH